MYIVYVRNYKQKLILFFLILALWVAAFLFSTLFINSSLLFNVTINNCLKFSYPVSYEVSNIFVSEQLSLDTVQTNASLKNIIKEKFSTYKSLKGKFSFDYPSLFMLDQGDFTGSEILYHIDFRDKSKTYRGFVQVWNLSHSLEQFLNDSKAASQQNYKNFKANKITVNSLDGYVWSYTVTSSNGNSFKGSEVFLKKADNMYRIAYFVPEKLWNKEQADIFRHIVESFKVH